jgi:hypothetical protein
MAFQFAPMLIGAGIGALGGLLTGRDPLKAAAVGGATGGLFGNLPAGAWGGGAAEVAKSGAPNIAAGATPVTLGSSSTLPTGADIGASFYNVSNPVTSYLPTDMAANYATNYAATTGAVPTVAQSFNPYTGLYDDALTGVESFNPYTGVYDDVLTGAESYVDKGLIGSTNFNPVANIGATSQQTPFFAGNEVIKDVGIPEESLFDQLKPYANVQNLAGASMIANQFNQRPQMPTAPSGGVSRGQAPQGTDVMALLASVKPREQRRISLL